MVSAASGRTCSSNVSSAAGPRPAGSSSPSSGASVWARRSTRWPELDSSSTLARTAGSGAAGGEQDLRRPHHPAALVLEGGAAPLAGRRERHGARPGPAGRRVRTRPPGRPAWRSGGGRRPGRRARTAARSPVWPPRRSRWRAKRDRAVGEGAGLVEAHDVDPGQALDRGQLLDEHLAAGQAQRGDEEGDAGEQHEPLGDHAHQRGHGADDGVGGALVAPGQLADQEDRSDDHERPADVAQQGVDALHQLGAGLREPLGLRRQPVGVGVGADRGRLEASRPRRRRSSRRAPGPAEPCRPGRTRPVSSDSSISRPSRAR